VTALGRALPLLASLLALPAATCAASPQHTRARPRPGSLTGPRPVDRAGTAVRARIALGPIGWSEPSGWDEIRVEGTDERAVARCEQWIARQAARVAEGHELYVLAPCSVDALPVRATPTSARAVWLERYSLESPLDALERGPLPASSACRIELFESFADCEGRRAAYRAETAEHDAAALAWLEAQLVEQQRRRDETCAPREAGPEGSTAIERTLQEVEDESARRSCALEQQALDSLRNRRDAERMRLGSPSDAPPCTALAPGASAPTCD